MRRGFAVIKSPADGVIAARLAEEGNICSPSHPLYRITVSGGARVQARLPQTILAATHPGTKMVLTNGKSELTVPVARVFPALDGLALGKVEADLDDHPFNLPSGARIPARVIVEHRGKAIVVPADALLRAGKDGGKAKVFLIRSLGGKEKLVERSVVIDLETPQGVALLGDLKAGDRVVTAHQSVLLVLHDGDSVVTGLGENG